MEMRFIEFMPLDAEKHWQHDQVLTGEEIRRLIEEAIGPLEPADRPDPSQPATDFRFADGSGTVGFINPVTQPFCEDCNRLRLTAEGKSATACSRPSSGTPAPSLRGGGTDDELAQLVRDCVRAKKARPRHRLGRFRPPAAGDVSDRRVSGHMPSHLSRQRRDELAEAGGGVSRRSMNSAKLGAPAGAAPMPRRRRRIGCVSSPDADRRLMGAADPTRIVFTQNGTDSLNLALHGSAAGRPCRDDGLRAQFGAAAAAFSGSARRDDDTSAAMAGIRRSGRYRRAIRPDAADRRDPCLERHRRDSAGGGVGRIAAERGAYLVDAAQTLGMCRQ